MGDVLAIGLPPDGVRQASLAEDCSATVGGSSPSGQGQGLLEGFMLEGAGHAMDFLAVGTDFLGNAAP